MAPRADGAVSVDAAEREVLAGFALFADRAEVARLALVLDFADRADAADFADLPSAAGFVRADLAVVRFVALLDFVLLGFVLADFVALVALEFLAFPALRFPAAVFFAVGFRICPSLAGVRLSEPACIARRRPAFVSHPGRSDRAHLHFVRAFAALESEEERRRWRARVKPAHTLFRCELPLAHDG